MSDESEAHVRELVTYELTPRGYHLFTFSESSKRAMDQWFELAKPVMEAVQNEPVYRHIYDQRKSGLQPLTYSNQKAKELMKLYPVLPRLRLAVVVGSGGFFGQMVSSFANMFVSREDNELRIFGAQQFKEAEDWVMQDMTETAQKENNGSPS
jgi:hypothetical protein